MSDHVTMVLVPLIMACLWFCWSSKNTYYANKIKKRKQVFCFLYRVVLSKSLYFYSESFSVSPEGFVPRGAFIKGLSRTIFFHVICMFFIMLSGIQEKKAHVVWVCLWISVLQVLLKKGLLTVYFIACYLTALFFLYSKYNTNKK